jgi:hypothetical protein
LVTVAEGRGVWSIENQQKYSIPTDGRFHHKHKSRATKKQFRKMGILSEFRKLLFGAKAVGKSATNKAVDYTKEKGKESC